MYALKVEPFSLARCIITCQHFPLIFSTTTKISVRSMVLDHRFLHSGGWTSEQSRQQNSNKKFIKCWLCAAKKVLWIWENSFTMHATNEVTILHIAHSKLTLYLVVIIIIMANFSILMLLEIEIWICDLVWELFSMLEWAYLISINPLPQQSQLMILSGVPP